MTMFTKKGDEREASAQSRVDLWEDCWDVMQKNPVYGCGPNQWPIVAESYGWNKGKEAHSLWMQTGAELGFTGLLLLLGFYVSVATRCWILTWKRIKVPDPFHKVAAHGGCRLSRFHRFGSVRKSGGARDPVLRGAVSYGSIETIDGSTASSRSGIGTQSAPLLSQPSYRLSRISLRVSEVSSGSLFFEGLQCR